MNMLAEKSGGDVRRALNSLELAVRYTPPQSDGVVHLDARHGGAMHAKKGNAI